MKNVTTQILWNIVTSWFVCELSINWTSWWRWRKSPNSGTCIVANATHTLDTIFKHNQFFPYMCSCVCVCVCEKDGCLFFYVSHSQLTRLNAPSLLSSCLCTIWSFFKFDLQFQIFFLSHIAFYLMQILHISCCHCPYIHDWPLLIKVSMHEYSWILCLI